MTSDTSTDQVNGGAPTSTSVKPVLDWMALNNIDYRKVPDDAELHVDEVAGTISVEQFYRRDESLAIHARRPMTHMVTVPLLAAPEPGLVEAYQHSTGKLRRERGAVYGIRREVVDTIVGHITAEAQRTIRDAELAGNDGFKKFGAGLLSAATWHVWDAMGWPRPTADEPTG